jgi:hypothetical protein
MDQMTCKPGSVQGFWPLDDHSSWRLIAQPLARPTRTIPGGKALPRLPVARRPYLVLLLTGLAMPLPLPVARCALTAPFHPYLINKAVYFLWRYP